MNRFKFRAWNRHNKQMMNGVGITPQVDLNEPHIIDEWGEPNYSINEEHIMQSTGFKDINGKEIFEGDFIHINRGFNGTDLYAEVYWRDLGYCLRADSGLNSSPGYLIMVSPYAEVIGNIHEHPNFWKEEERT